MYFKYAFVASTGSLCGLTSTPQSCDGPRKTVRLELRVNLIFFKNNMLQFMLAVANWHVNFANLSFTLSTDQVWVSQLAGVILANPACCPLTLAYALCNLSSASTPSHNSCSCIRISCSSGWQRQIALL